ncbi:hypothetical protein SeLEV6574_g03957 [Synchytrium endobioticum]|nr:hypothetical protein SeLEV6574_g03957 [Synchytrium endobioticum]
MRIVQNQLITPGAPCRPVTLIWARESTGVGNVGLYVFPYLTQAVAKIANISQLTLQGVNYPAWLAVGLSGGDPNDGKNMANLTDYAASRCPNTQIVLGGYSQGAEVVRFALRYTTAIRNIHAVVTFGDPYNGQPFAKINASKTLVICHTTDGFCQGKWIFTPGHAGYGLDATQAATFIVSKVTL